MKKLSDLLNVEPKKQRFALADIISTRVFKIEN